MLNMKGPAWIKGRFFLSLLLLIAGAVYAIFPLDIIPDVLGPVGWIDDLGVLGAAFVNSAMAYLRLRRGRGK